jgi:AraC-like DNA-binding protein
MIRQITYYFPTTEEDRRWGFYVTGAGHATTEPHQSYPPQVHPSGYDFKWEKGRRLAEFGLLYLVRGQGTFESQQQSATSLKSGQAVILFPGEWHRYCPDPATGWEEYWITFGGSIVEGWRRMGFLNPERPLATTNLGISLASSFEELLRLLGQRTSRTAFVSSGLCHLLLGRVLNAATPPLVNSEKMVLDAADYLRLHAAEPVDLPELASRFGMSYSGFRRAFARYLNIPPHRFHQQARIALAKELLGSTELPLKAVAERLHYPSEFYLMQTFKRQTGLTPTQWRNHRLIREVCAEKG